MTMAPVSRRQSRRKRTHGKSRQAGRRPVEKALESRAAAPGECLLEDRNRGGAGDRGAGLRESESVGFGRGFRFVWGSGPAQSGSENEDLSGGAEDGSLPGNGEEPGNGKEPADGQEERYPEESGEGQDGQESDTELSAEGIAVEEGINSYELIVADVTWSQAYYDCLDRGGHLVRITTDAEYQAILQQIASEERRTSYSGWAAPAMTTVGITGSIMTVISGRKSSMRMQNTPLTGWTMSPASMTMPQGWTRPGYVCSGSAAAGSGCGTMCRTTSSRWQAFIPGRLGISVNMSEI